jgi:hypothetical protein
MKTTRERPNRVDPTVVANGTGHPQWTDGERELADTFGKAATPGESLGTDWIDAGACEGRERAIEERHHHGNAGVPRSPASPCRWRLAGCGLHAALIT